MDQNARRRIDNARDVLVGKIPDPKAQVEQITTALIYKFMDDMDKDAQGLGGKPTFFTNGYEKYAWSHILDPRLGGQERLDRYAEALATMSQNPHLPQLFRTIFKDAFLPYRDPTTLNLFLKEIDGFTYDHSENLGDAYEYLLSILGSQGDAGQFRTPRHIIDFMVRVVDPKKNETMLDPASGTAGFLISSYRHIIDQNHDHQLTPDEKERLAGNLQGYDIAPDMVRIGLVNMYLHSFPNPHIYEYDTLTSEERWDEQFDICMANPPFMTPKGGIRPHKRFQIQANRSEVLFVDYIAEHLKPTGRAAVIVPEGIIFQSANAYKALRKMLVETWGLWAVVSLPAGVFHPYSGVKTSILFLDRVFAKKTHEVLFVKAQNDGFDLGAQRRAIDKNDLPAAQEVLQAWHNGAKQETPIANWVGKEIIAETGDYNLSGERYREGGADTSHWPMVPLGTVVEIESGSRQKGGAIESGIPSIGGEQIDEKGKIRFNKMKYISEEHFRGMTKGVLRSGDVLIVKDGATTGKTSFFIHDMPSAVNEHVFILRAKEAIHPYYLYCVVRAEAFQEKLRPFIKGIIGGISLEFSSITVPLPPLSVQQQIVAEIDGYQKVIDGARAVLDNYRPHISIDPDWPTVKLGEACDIYNGSTPSRKEATYWSNGTVPWFTVDDIRKSGRIIRGTIQSVTEEALAETSLKLLPTNTVLLCCTASVGEYAFTEIEVTTNQQFNGLVVKKSFSDCLSPKFLFYLSGQFKDELLRLSGKTSFNFVSGGTLKTLTLVLPPLATQQAIVAEIEAEQALVAANRELIARFEKKIQATLARVWGEETSQGEAQ